MFAFPAATLEFLRALRARLMPACTSIWTTLAPPHRWLADNV